MPKHKRFRSKKRNVPLNQVHAILAIGYRVKLYRDDVTRRMHKAADAMYLGNHKRAYALMLGDEK